MKLLLHLFYFLTEWHLCCIKHIFSFFLSWSWSRVSEIRIWLYNLLLRIKGLKNTFIYLSLLLLPLLSFFYLNLKELNLLIHNSNFLFIFLFFNSIFLFDFMKFFKASIAPILQNLVNFIFILIYWSKPDRRSYRGNWTLSSFVITYLRRIACILIVSII